MKRIFALTVVATLPVLAESPAQFRSAAPITLTGSEALHRVELPFEAYAGSRRDMGDIRVFNANGDAVPIAFGGDPDVVREVAGLVELPMFPVSSIAPAVAGPRGTEITVRAQDGTLVSIKGARGRPGEGRGPIAILLDATKVEEPIRALLFEWAAAPGTEIVRVRVEASDDLKDWSSVGSGPLVKLESAGRSLTQPRLEFAPRKAKYLRLTWDAQGFQARQVRAERAPKVQPAPRSIRTVTPAAGEKPGEWIYDLGARLPVEAFRLVPQTTNDVVAATILTRNEAKDPWRLTASAPFYRLQLEGGEKQSPPIEIGRITQRYWLARMAGRADNAQPPTLEVQWRPAQLVFVAHGRAPYTLSFGSAQAPPVAMSVGAVIPEYKPHAEAKLPLAKLGAVTSGPEPTRLEKIMADASPKRIALWVVLLAAVAVLGFLAWRLSRASSSNQ